MIMPDSLRTNLYFREELAIWRTLAVPHGELHVRADSIEAIATLKRMLEPHQEIPFLPEAESIDSAYTEWFRSNGNRIYSFGWKLS